MKYMNFEHIDFKDEYIISMHYDSETHLKKLIKDLSKAGFRPKVEV